MMKSSKNTLKNLKLALCVPSLLLSLSVNAELSNNGIRAICHENVQIVSVYTGYVPWSSTLVEDVGKYGEAYWGIQIEAENGDRLDYVVNTPQFQNDRLYKTVLYAYETKHKIDVMRRYATGNRCSAHEAAGAFNAIILKGD
jgi:hypothetical protein